MPNSSSGGGRKEGEGIDGGRKGQREGGGGTARTYIDLKLIPFMQHSH